MWLAALLFMHYILAPQVLFPPSHTLAVLEFFEPSEARVAFKSLAYKKFKHVPLYLEWAPSKLLPVSAPTSDRTRNVEEKKLIGSLLVYHQ